jgi:transposase
MTIAETTTGRTREYYELGHSDWELERLKRQATLLDPFTRQFYREAGIAEGMKVLGIGCGAGCAALVLAELVGESGSVLGIDRAPAAVASAAERARKLDKRNISFCVAEVSFPWLRHIFADGGYAGQKLKAALKGRGGWTLEIVKRSDAAKGFVLLPRRWVVERTFAWFGRNRRLAKDFEQTIESATAWLLLASIQLMTRRVANL